jgi:hypothetical protein
MADRIRGFTVALEHDMREDDCESIKSAILQLRGVLSVDQIVADYESYISERRAKTEVWERLREVLK